MNRRLLRTIAFLFPAIGWFLWSFILTDRALVYSQNALFLRIQNFMWQFAGEHLFLSVSYVLLVVLLFIVYTYVINTLRTKEISLRKVMVPLGLFFLLFALSNPALSYDIFNYIFDAKLVAFYHLDPHMVSAINFIEKDDWVRFMRNIFFPTTYGYMWTALSLVPFVMGMGKFLLVFISFKLFMLFGLLLLFLLQRYMFTQYVRVKRAQSLHALSLFFLSPLVILEVLSSGHNDIWMMLLAFLSLALLFPRNVIFGEKEKLKGKVFFATFLRIVLSLALLFASSQVKRSTVLLLPVWAILASGQVIAYLDWKSAKRFIVRVGIWWADAGAVLLFMPLLTPLSRQFHPWYLIWAFSFVPFVRSKLLRYVMIGFSVSSTLRYLPVLYFGTYTDALEMVQKLITWSALPVSILAWYISSILVSKKKKT